MSLLNLNRKIILAIVLSIIFSGSVYAATKVLPKVAVSGEQIGIKKGTTLAKSGSTRTGSVNGVKIKNQPIGKTATLKIPDLKNIDPLELENLIKIYVNARIKELKDSMKGRCPAGMYVVGFEDDGTKICEGLTASTSNNSSTSNTTASNLPFATNVGGIGAHIFFHNGKKYIVSQSDFRATWTSVNTSCLNYVQSGFSGWRLPTKDEFNSLLDYAKGAIKNTNSYWTSTKGASENARWKKFVFTGAGEYSAITNTYSAVCILEVQ